MSTNQEDRAEFERQFGETIRRERERRGWTADEAARLAGLAPKTWQRLEDGKPVRNKTFKSVDAIFGLSDGTTVRVWIDRGDLQSELNNARTDEPEALVMDAVDPRPDRRINFARYMISEHRRISGRGQRAALFDLITVAVNELPLEDIDSVEQIVRLAKAAREVELQIDGDMTNSIMIIPEIAGVSVESITFSPEGVDYAQFAEALRSLGEKLDARGDDGER